MRTPRIFTEPFPARQPRVAQVPKSALSIQNLVGPKSRPKPSQPKVKYSIQIQSVPIYSTQGRIQTNPRFRSSLYSNPEPVCIERNEIVQIESSLFKLNPDQVICVKSRQCDQKSPKNWHKKLPKNWGKSQVNSPCPSATYKFGSPFPVHRVTLNHVPLFEFV